MKTVTIRTIEELARVAGDVLALCGESAHVRVITLQGDLGAGKTAFTKELAKHLGVQHEITSPTFVVMKSYPIPSHPFFKTLTHIDAYRIEDEDEMRVLGFNEMLQDPSQLICIEWPEKIAGLIPRDVISVSITLNPDETRSIVVEQSNDMSGA